MTSVFPLISARVDDTVPVASPRSPGPAEE